MEQTAKMTGTKGEELSTLLLDIEERRYAQESANRKAAFEKETKDVVEFSAEWYAIRNKYNAMEELAERQHQQKMGDIRKSGIDGELNNIKESYERLMNALIIQREGGEITGLEKLSLDAQMAKEQLDKFAEMTFPLDTIQRELDAGLMSFEDYSAQRTAILEELGMTEQEYYDKLAQMQADALEKQRKFSDAQRDAVMASANSIADSFNSIGESLQELTGENLTMTIAMQTIAMAQVLANQAVAISAAIKTAMSDPTNINIMQAIASAAAGVAAVLAQVVSAKTAIERSRQALSNVEAYAEGTTNHQGGDAVVGEGGKPELVVAGNKTFIVEKPTLIKDLPVGSRVTPLDVQRVSDSTQQIDLTGVYERMDRIEKRDRVHIDVGRNVYSYIVKGASRARILNKQFSH
jgi:hypothetical protein